VTQAGRSSRRAGPHIAVPTPAREKRGGKGKEEGGGKKGAHLRGSALVAYSLVFFGPPEKGKKKRCMWQGPITIIR